MIASVLSAFIRVFKNGRDAPFSRRVHAALLSLRAPSAAWTRRLNDLQPRFFQRDGANILPLAPFAALSLPQCVELLQHRVDHR